MLTTARLKRILHDVPTRKLGVVGDLFLDRYLDLDAALTEASLETGLDAYQVVGVRSSPGAAGTVINNLVALGVAQVCVVAVIGDDGEGYELRQALARLPGVDTSGLLVRGDRRTPTYTKPMLRAGAGPARELNRLDIKNRTPLPSDVERALLDGLERIWPQIDGLIVLDQVREEDCGVVTRRMRQRLAELGEAHPRKVILADSRHRIGQFRAVWTKPNESECLHATADPSGAKQSIEASARELSQRTGRPVFCTSGERGIYVIASGSPGTWVPAYPVTGPIDTVGAGDSVNAALGCALASGASLPEAAALGNLIASVTIGQLGTTGTATAEQVRARFRQVQDLE